MSGCNERCKCVNGKYRMVFLKLTFHIWITKNVLINILGKSLQFPCANEADFWPKIIALSSRKQSPPISKHPGLTFRVVFYGRFNCIQNFPILCVSGLWFHDMNCCLLATNFKLALIYLQKAAYMYPLLFYYWHVLILLLACVTHSQLVGTLNFLWSMFILVKASSTEHVTCFHH